MAGVTLFARLRAIWSAPEELAALRARVIELEGWRRPKAKRLSRAARHKRWLRELRNVPTTEEERREWEEGMA